MLLPHDWAGHMRFAHSPEALASSHSASISASVDCAGRAARLGEARLDVAEAADELLVRGPQRRLRIELQVARDVGDDEQEIAELLLDLRPGGSAVDLGFQLADLLLELGEHRGERRPVEADAGGFVLQLDGARERGKRRRERRQARRRAALRPRT